MKNKNTEGRFEGGFTRLELIMVFATLGLLASVALPALATTKFRSQQIGCFNNLRQIGRGFQLWANDHDGQNPYRTPRSEGGLFLDSSIAAQLVYFQFAWLSNELATPKILACPSDDTVRLAQDFSNTLSVGLLSIANRNKSVSYTLGLHASFDYPQSLLSGDRNIRVLSRNACFVGINDAYALYPSSSATWTNAFHGEAGNLLSNDGRVEYVGNPGLRRAVTNTPGTSHYISP